MTDNNLPITPPDELVQKWDNDWHRAKIKHDTLSAHVATHAARWGYEQRGAVNEAKLQKARDEELDACCEWMLNAPFGLALNRGASSDQLRAARRPKPKSQAEEALEAQSRMWAGSATHDDWELVRSSLERLQELEALDD